MVTNSYWAGLAETYPWLRQNYFGNQLWQYAVFFLYVLAAVVLSKGADLLLTHGAQRWAGKTATQWDNRFLRLVQGPLRLVVFLFFMHLGVGVMRTPEWLQIYLRRGFGVVVGVVITYAIVRVVDLTHDILAKRFQDQDRRVNLQILVLMRKAVKVFVIATAILVTADNIGIKITGVLAGLGVTGLAVAMASQETLSNLLGSIVILADRPFLVGDRIKIGPDEGVVEHIGVRSTRLRTNDGDVITIPNKNITSATVRNYSKTTQQLTQTPTA
jgi:MscS family membrane protein